MFMECLACWPFGTKGHYHLPSAFSPILADFVVKSRFIKDINTEVAFVHDTWNVQGRYMDYQTIATLTGLNYEHIEKNYEEIIKKELKNILSIGKEIATSNIDSSRSIKNKLNLLPSGLYVRGQLVKPLEFRDDSEISWKTAQKMFLQLYKEGFVYWNEDPQNPKFFLDMSKLLSSVPLERLLEKTDMPSFATDNFRNDYRIYKKDMPLSTTRAYATPIPLYISETGRLIIPNENDLPINTKINGLNIKGKILKNPSLSIKPLFNLYFLSSMLEEMVGKEFDRITYSNDQSLITRFNFPQLLLSSFFGKNRGIHKQIFYELLVNENGQRFSFKRNLTLSLEELTKNGSSLARFIVAKNLKIGGGKIIFQKDIQTYNKLIKTIKELQKREISNEGGVESGLFKKRISDFESIYNPIVESFDIRRGLNFLVDCLFKAKKIQDRLPKQVDTALKHLDAMLCIKKD